MLNYTRWSGANRLGNLISSKPTSRSATKRTGRKSRSLRIEELDPRLLLTVDPIVTFNTSMGSFQVELFADAAPQTVANFLKYVNAGSYSNTFFHRTVTIAKGGIGIVQGGGFSASSVPFPPAPSHIGSLTSPALPLESTLANSIGTIAMARTSDPNSGSSEFFFNSHDNTSTLPAGASGGYTVFGKVLGNGLTILQQIEATQTLNDFFPSYQGSSSDPSNLLGPIPLVNFTTSSTEIDANNLIIVNSVTIAGGSFSGKVFIDQDSNGQINGPDAGKAGFTVFIDTNDDGLLSAGEVSTVTDANGAYTFNVAPGNYIVRIQQQTGWAQTSPTAAAPALGALRFSIASNQALTDENFGLAVVLSTPSTPVLPSAFDSGSSNSDGKTNLKSLQFTVGGVQSGATVTLLDGQNVIGTAVAQGTSVTIVPAAQFADGTHSITATQSLFGQTSSASGVRTVIVQTTAPIISSTPPANAVVGALYSYTVTTGPDVVALSLLNPLSGMVAPTLATPLTWTPAADQIGVRSTTLVATDVFGNTAQQQIQIAVNGPPFFPAIPDQKVNQGALLSFTPTASDLDPLTWSLGNDAPNGASINPTTGLFTWQPTAAVAAGTYAITVTVQDPGGLTASQVLHVVVNAPPVIAVIDPQTVNEGTTLSFQIPATDQEAITYQLIGTPPAGASVSSSGLFTWHPTKDQVGSDYTFTVRVTDTGGLTADRTFTVSAIKLHGTFSGTVFVDQNDDGQINGADSGKAGFTVYIDANDDGQLNDGEESTVTDANGNYSFDGLPGDYVVRIVPQSGWGQTSPAGQDGQRFTLAPNEIVTGKNFGLTIVLANPDKPVLPSVFDSGLLNNDGNTNQTQLQFVVTGVQAGATVTLYDNGVQIGSGVAQGNTITIVPNAAFADGSHSITAKQSAEGKTSNASESRSVVVKTTPPEITSTPPATAIVGAPYTYNVAFSADVVQFSLLNAPAGMVAPTLNAPLTWTPTAAQAGPQTATLVATDLFGNTVEQVLSIDVNAPPNFPPIPTQLVNQGTQLSFTPTVTDLNTLTWTLGDGTPDGVSIDQNGLITWSTTSATPPGQYSITVNVVDPGGLGASQVMHVIVNAPPVFSAVDSKVIDEGKTLSFQLPVTDQDTLIYEFLGDAPAGASINANGLFTWQPTEAQGGAVYSFTVKVTDTGGFTAQQSFNVTVNKVDSAPSIAAVNPITVTRGQTVNLVASGTDSDLPFSGITFSLDAGAPAGATIDPNTGAFSWQVPSNYPLGKTTITIRVTDKTEAALSATTTVEIVVNPVASIPGDGTDVGVDDDLLHQLASNPGIAALLVGPFNALGNLPTIPSGPAVLQQLSKVAVDRAVLGLSESPTQTFGAIDLFSPLDNGLSHDRDQMELEMRALAQDQAGGGDGEQPKGDATQAGHVEPIDVIAPKQEKSPPPRLRSSSVPSGARNFQNQLPKQGALNINVAPQAKAWPTAESFKAQLQKAEALKLQAAQVEASKGQASQRVNSTASKSSGSGKTESRDDQSRDRANERARSKITTAATAAMIPLLIGNIEARDKRAERNRKR